MGVVTDVTVKGLTTAVTNISATGMSDTTGQAIVTSINNLRSATSPIITDDTGQAINTTLQSLVTAITTNLQLSRTTVTVTVSSGQTGSANTYIPRSKIVSIIPIYSDDFFYDPVITTLTTTNEIEVRTTKGTAVTAQRSYTFDVIYTNY